MRLLYRDGEFAVRVVAMVNVSLVLSLLNITNFTTDRDATAGDWHSFENAPFEQRVSGWHEDIYFPTRIRSLANRRVVVCKWGEVFWQRFYSERCDVIFSRSRHRLPATAILVHYTQYADYMNRFPRFRP